MRSGYEARDAPEGNVEDQLVSTSRRPLDADHSPQFGYASCDFNEPQAQDINWTVRQIERLGMAVLRARSESC